jgi:hypothetical protein
VVGGLLDCTSLGRATNTIGEDLEDFMPPKQGQHRAYVQFRILLRTSFKLIYHALVALSADNDTPTIRGSAALPLTRAIHELPTPLYRSIVSMPLPELATRYIVFGSLDLDANEMLCYYGEIDSCPTRTNFHFFN